MKYFTSESVCAGHPDKIADQISDAIVDAALEQDPQSRVAVETLVTTDRVVLAGEVKTEAKLDYAVIAQEVIAELGYVYEEWGFWHRSPVEVLVHEQASDIAQGVDEGGAGDQGMMFGYACRQSKELMPLPIVLAHELAKAMDGLHTSYAWIRPDGKTQVTVAYETGKPVEVETVVLAKPHDLAYSNDELKHVLVKELVEPVLGRYGFEVGAQQVIVNGTGQWEIGGPHSDTGLTGRKIVVDGYGGWARVGGGAFSGKDATKVDRSGAYAARYIAKNLVANGLCEECEVRVAYVIGKAEPVWVQVDDFGTAKKSAGVLRSAADELLSLRVPEIIESLQLRKPQYKQAAAYGHFGREGVSWEVSG